MIYSLDKINEMAEGDTDFIESVVSVFLEEVPEDLELLGEAISKKDYTETYKLAHKIKPNVDLLGMEQTRAAAYEIESMGKESGDYERITELFDVLKKDIHQVIGELKKDFSL